MSKRERESQREWRCILARSRCRPPVVSGHYDGYDIMMLGICCARSCVGTKFHVEMLYVLVSGIWTTLVYVLMVLLRDSIACTLTFKF